MSVRCFYNENDPFAAAWLRELQRDGEIADGRIDERSIVEIDAGDLAGYVRCHFFAGIGGWDYALALAGWPDDRPVWTGSCPCQPFSAAGRQGGSSDARHLWPRWLRLIRECRPDTLLGEQVEGAVGFGWIDRVFADLEAEGYACGAAVLGAHSVGAPHIRQRLYWVAHTAASRQQPAREGPEAEARNQTRLRRSERGCATGGVADADGGQSGYGGLQRSGQHRQRQEDGGAGERLEIPSGAGLEGPGERTARGLLPAPWAASIAIPCADGKFRRVPASGQAEVESSLFPLAHGVSARMGTLRGAGNAICPQTAAEFIAAFLESESR